MRNKLKNIPSQGKSLSFSVALVGSENSVVVFADRNSKNDPFGKAVFKPVKP